VRVFGLILAGGQATRLGGVDKPLLPLGGRKIIDFLLERVRPQVLGVAISANGDPARYAAYECAVLADRIAGRGPLGGVLRGLEWAEEQGADALLTVPGDTPFVPENLAARLSPGPACAENASGPHFPVALWPITVRKNLAAWLASQQSGRVSAFGALIGLRRVWFDDAGDPFQNINTPADLEAALRNV
jgi:molybdopterin-guanine dinucleotide biosynthesis protein A